MQPHSLTLAGTLAPGILLLLFPMKTSLYSLRPVSLACAAVCASLFTPVAFAQTATTPQLKETVVSASRIEQALQTAPIGASVILGEDIRASGMLDANEAVRKLGGVAARSDLNGDAKPALTCAALATQPPIIWWCWSMACAFRKTNKPAPACPPSRPT